jgi:ubiquinone biosynthesis monooxygenase Coq7
MAQPTSIYKERAESRHFSPIDRLISHADEALRTVTGVHRSHRPYPAETVKESVSTSADRGHVAALMRVNHAGEVAAQALYAGQALTARGSAAGDSLRQAAQEESDHLAWCSKRIDELGGRKSVLNPIWYAGSFAIGALAGIAGDRESLGFVAETEKQVVEHLSSHLQQLPQGDARTRAIVEQMRSDEAHHGLSAQKAGGIALPLPVRALMKMTARVMTRTAYWI